MIIKPFAPAQYAGVRWEDLVEGMAWGTLERHWLAWALKRAEMSWAFTGIDYQGRVLVSAGLMPQGRGVADAWAIITPRARERGVKIFFRLRRGLAELASTMGLRQIQAAVLVDHALGRRLAVDLGFREAGSMYGFGPDQADYLIYVRRT